MAGRLLRRVQLVASFGRLRRERQAVACPDCHHEMDCTLIFDTARDEWRAVHRCSAMESGEHGPCECRCIRFMNQQRLLARRSYD